MNKLILLGLLALLSVGSYAQSDYSSLISKAERLTLKNAKRSALAAYKEALVLNPMGYEALVNIGQYNVNQAVLERIGQRDSLFRAGLNILQDAIVSDTSKMTYVNLLVLDGYNKNLTLNYQRLYDDTTVKQFFCKIDSIYKISQKRHDYHMFSDKYEAIYLMLSGKK